ncbi:hypothetical protein FQR65_LT14941 [Abscondita terminalis]|nr:hypothetical protein FQR65_LT14941 [Abscondita terminalis]
MTELCDQQEQLNPLLSSPPDTICKEDEDAASKIVDNTDTGNEALSEPKQDSITNEKIRQLFFKMYLVFKEIAIILFVAFTYAAMTNDTPKLSKSPAAFPFFPKHSIVTDWYHGELSSAIIKARESDIAFVMFYAAWDAESQVMRKEFDLAAQYMHKEISFAAVNCWQPNSECRKQYSKAYSWPVLIAYPTHGKGIQYKGPQLATYMVKFLKTISRPFIRIHEVFEVNELLTTYDAVVLACLDVSPGSSSFGVFYTTAIRFLEKDPLQEVAFAIITDYLSCSGNTPSLSLHMWNETLLYSNEEWKSSSLLTWILSSLHQVSMWVSPTGSKSLSLSSHLQPGPTLILFTPRNPLTVFVDYYALLHEVALEYYNCGNNVIVQVGSSLIKKKRQANRQNHRSILDSCLIKSQEKLPKFSSTITFTMPKKWANSSCDKCDTINLLSEQVQMHCEQKHTTDGVCERPLFDESVQFCEKNDPKSTKNLIKLWNIEKCRIAVLAEKVQPLVFSEHFLFNNLTNNISGLGCKTNSSLSFIALDSVRYFHFAQKLGIDISLFKDKSAAVIINQKAETHHILNEGVNDETIREFINNFTITSLPRSYNSEVTINYKSIRKKDISDINLLELNAETFLPVVMQENKAVIVFYYSKQCSFCSGISYTFLTVAKMFQSINSIRFTRVDGDMNILPWAFTMDRYPTIIFFPSKSKSESRVYPRDIPTTISNLVSFILVNLSPSLKLHAMWTLCNRTKFEDEKQSCIASLRAENLSVINNTLRSWRIADSHTKTKLLFKLQQLRNLNFLLAHSPDNEDDIKRYLDRLHFVTYEDSPLRNVEKNAKINNHDEL